MRWIVIVRSGALLVGVAAIVYAVVASAAPYRDTMAFRHAHLCSGGVPTPVCATHGCIAREIGSVTGRDTHVETTTDESGEQADLETWRGEVVWITVAGQSDGFDPSTEGALTSTAVLAWVGLGLLLWFLLRDGTLRHLFGNFGFQPIGWVCFGFWTASMIHDALTYQMGTLDYAFLGVLWPLSLALCGYGVFGGLGEYHGEDSLVQVLRRRGIRGKVLRRWEDT
ncbi:hypothetical protein [Streptomyces turgidiscabies]|uniref:Integral membrane protein n=1 Tax=Streptomyces turgidiscabies TaxID=85558 RepID=A0ABU0S0J6_9ACTN|nr:hypothetical protein [Streptomyces turgidiscabies]MDQ0937593.1 hypothetical protein [Streptomyces turgidiscabies]